MRDDVWMLELGARVGPFRLGDSLVEVLHILKNRMPVRPLEIAYDAAKPFARPIVVDSAEEGFKLRFDPVQQILNAIEFYDITRVALQYGRTVVCGGEHVPTFMSVYNLFGPTFPGHYDASDQHYYLGYEGGCFKFPIPAEFAHLYTTKTDLPMEFPNGTTPVADGLVVFAGESLEHPSLPAPTKRFYYEPVEIEVRDSATVVSFKERKQQIELSWTPQEVVSAIGPPASVFRKSEDPDNSASVAGGTIGEYFHNYPHLGFDLMYDALHSLSKVIIKTNAVGHPDFGVYQKCNFRVAFLSSSTPEEAKDRIPFVTPETPWDDIASNLGASDLRPVVQDNGLGMHPFGSTLCYSPLSGCTFEVMKNGYLASITLSRSS